MTAGIELGSSGGKVDTLTEGIVEGNEALDGAKIFTASAGLVLLGLGEREDGE